MILAGLRLENVRCHDRLELRFDGPSTVLVGRNGSGKTSVLEAIHLVLAGSSPRTAFPRDLIRQGESFLRVEADLAPSFSEPTASEAVTAAIAYDASGERRATANGAPLSDLSRWQELLPIRIFLPDHLQLVKGGPRRRRQFVDRFGAEAHYGHIEGLGRYEEALRQRNSLLKQGIVNEQHTPWEMILAREGLGLAERRAELLRALAPFFSRAYLELAPSGQEAKLVYRTNTSGLDEMEYRRLLDEQRLADRQRLFTHLGPHRDDVRFSLEGRDLREYGSQGEQRSVLLALLLAEKEWAAEEQRQPPLLLLDDVMSELDLDRRRNLLALVGSSGQVLFTTTTLDEFPQQELRGMRTKEIACGKGQEKLVGKGEEP